MPAAALKRPEPPYLLSITICRKAYLGGGEKADRLPAPRMWQLFHGFIWLTTLPASKPPYLTTAYHLPSLPLSHSPPYPLSLGGCKYYQRLFVMVTEGENRYHGRWA